MEIGAAAICVALYFAPVNTPWLGLADVCQYAVFFLMGIVWCDVFAGVKEKINVAGKIILIGLGLLASVLLFAYLYRYTAVKLLIAVFMIGICYLMATLTKENNLCRWISANNYTIYLYSWLAQSVVMMACDKLGVSWPVTFALMFGGGLLCPIVMILIYNKLPKMHNRFFDAILGIK